MSISSASVEKNSQLLTLDISSGSKQNKCNDSGSDTPVMAQHITYFEAHDELKTNFFTLVPQEIRLQLLHFLVYRRHPITASDDFFSYAQTCKAGSNDVQAYHEIISDPQQALLASRSLIKWAWTQSLTYGISSRAIKFQEVLQKFTLPYAAVYLDVRGDTTWLPYINYQTRDTLPLSSTAVGPESIGAATLLSETHDLTLMLGRKISIDSPLESYRLEGRIIFDRHPQPMSDFPEIYRELDFFLILDNKY